MGEAKTKCVAVIQCQDTHRRCTGAKCAVHFKKRVGLFVEYGDDVEYFVPFPCGGCPGRSVWRLAGQLDKVMSRQGIGKDETAVHLASCVALDNAHSSPCPHVDDMRTMLLRRGYRRIVEGTCLSKVAERKRADGVYARRAGQSV